MINVIKWCSELDQIQDFIQVNLDEFTGPNFTEVLLNVQLVEPNVSVLGLPSPLSSCGLGVLRCLDNIPLGVLNPSLVELYLPSVILQRPTFLIVDVVVL